MEALRKTTCTYRYKDNKGNVVGYTLYDGKVSKVMGSDDLKKSIISGSIFVDNLILTSDNRLCIRKYGIYDTGIKSSKIKMIALDLDDTLLMPDCTIPKEVIDALNKAINRGVYVIIATGRIFPSAKKYSSIINSNLPILCYNGAVVKTVSENVIFSSAIDVPVIKKIAEYCKENNLYLQLYHDDKIIVEKDCNELRIDPDSKNTDCLFVGDLTKADLKSTPKMMILDKPDVIYDLYCKFARLYGRDLNLATSKDYLLEMLPKKVSKSRILNLLCQQMGIYSEEVMTIGDGLNDREMIQWAGLGVAVANATELCRITANYVAKAERSYGVLEAVNKFVLNE